jgi:putative ABC transport system permease protein
VIRTRWQKVLLDLWNNRIRTIVVALAIAVGVYAVGVVLDVREMLLREYNSDQNGALMASVILYTTPFDEDLAARVAKMPGVSAAEGRITVRAHVYDQNGTRRELTLAAVDDLQNMQVDTVTPISGPLSPGKRQVLLERLVPDYLGVQVGQTLELEMDNGATKELTVAGIVHDPQEMSPDITSSPIGYVTTETMGALGAGELYAELHVCLSERPRDEAHINAVADQIQDQLENNGQQVFSRRVITERHADPFIATIVLILSSFGFVILLLSGFLVVNAISALITQQMPQIGVMKLIGARRWQIMSLYMITVLVYGLMAVVVGIPLAVLTARLIMVTMVRGLLNVMIDSLAVSLPLLAAQAGVGLLLPLLAGLVPVLKGTSITTQKALSDTGVEAGAYGQRWVESLLARLQKLLSVQRPVLLAIRNTLRHKGRLAQTLIVLIIGSALFMSVLSVRASVDTTVENFMRYHQYDVALRLDRPYRIARLEQLARQVPGVVAVEGWLVGGTTRTRPDGTDSEGFEVYGVPVDSSLMQPEATQGRWLSGPGSNELVINSDVVDKERDVRVGQELVLDIDGREESWQVVGIVPTESRGPAVYMALEDYAHVTRTAGQANRLQVVTDRHDAASQHEMETQISQRLEDAGVSVGSTETTQVMRDENKLTFTIIVTFLLLMACLLAGVGGLGLTTTMSINVMERVREIGVLRAMGASNRSVGRIVLGEGAAMGLLSWTAGALLSWPISTLMSREMGLALIKIPLNFHYSFGAAILWFFVLQVVAVVASMGPARNAVRLTIREVLAYE